MPAPVFVSETPLPDEIAEGFTGGPSFDTVVIKTRSGYEQRFMRSDVARWRYTFDKHDRTAAQLEQLDAFFLTKRGMFRGWRFRDPSDYQVSTLTPMVAVTGSVWQATKKYSFGGVDYIRTLYKLIAGTVHIFDNLGAEVTTGFVVDVNTGLVTFTAAPSYTPRLTCEFHVPVRLMTDMMNRTLEFQTIRHWDRIEIIDLLG